MKVVIDTSVIVNLFSGFYPDRTEIAKRVAKLAEKGLAELYAPIFGEIEFISVMRRFLEEEETREAHEIYLSLLSGLVEEELIISRLRELAFKTAHRVPDLYFIAAAEFIGAILITNDRKMADLAKSLGLKAFYLVEESDEFFKALGVSS
ncbi:type II toxin-antitoxin system VapC family toxin [Thermococcus gorgonarius]|uniref:Nucleotide-binding protein n=1 Tax=Thermococcus gorgonarius TaxID=71997 RepID=A0A2Z2MFF9_THEGO|nr:type II toxin-antitoxin system VapC family toxin [Thermococcus gorgonarius]ASJ01191.1 nucleotide-binding protein [Thermococcus gorgonarius]